MVRPQRHDIIAAPGFAEVCEALGQFLRPEFPPEFDTKQSAVASYSRVGFKTAAVTALGIRADQCRSGPSSPTATRPYDSTGLTPSSPSPIASGYSPLTGKMTDFGGQEWAGVPVFSAWVTYPDDTPADDEHG